MREQRSQNHASAWKNRLFRILAALLAERQIVFDRPGESVLQLRYGPPLEGDDVA